MGLCGNKRVTPEDSQWIRNIPVTFANDDGLFSDRNLTLTQGRNATVDLKVYGKRQDLLKLGDGNITITADLADVPGPGEWQLRYKVEMFRKPSATTIFPLNPAAPMRSMCRWTC